MLSSDFTMELGTMRARNAALKPKVQRLVQGIMLRQEDLSTGYMKSNARWTDRTANARNGLHATYDGGSGDTHTLTLAHGVPYGIYLEVRFAGRYAIILNAVQNGGANVMRLLDKGMSRL
jgi:hypothetical protein